MLLTEDVELGYVDNNYSIINDQAVPKEIISFIMYFKSFYPKVNIKIRAKPHQSQSKLMRGFHYVHEQNSLAADIFWSDHVCSCLSAVSVSASLVKIPSYFYISRLKPSHKITIDSYSESIEHLHFDLDFKSSQSLFNKNSDWILANKNQRRKILTEYSQIVLRRFYKFADACAKS